MGDTILDRIVREKYQEVAAAKKRIPLPELLEELQSGDHAFYQALVAGEWALIAECKLASPIKGVFSPQRTVAELAALYAAHGATALSVLTDRHFSGCLADIAAARTACQLPLLRKDFIVDPYQVYEARAAGADAVLLIAGVLPQDEIQQCLDVAQELKMDCLVEVHTLPELQQVLKTSAIIIGINNRNLKTFTTDICTTQQLLPYCNRERLIISESGIRNREDACRLKAWGVNGILVGEGLVTAPDIGACTRELSLK